MRAKKPCKTKLLHKPYRITLEWTGQPDYRFKKHKLLQKLHRQDLLTFFFFMLNLLYTMDTLYV
jgi:hypothetical protein